MNQNLIFPRKILLYPKINSIQILIPNLEQLSEKILNHFLKQIRYYQKKKSGLWIKENSEF